MAVAVVGLERVTTTYDVLVKVSPGTETVVVPAEETVMLVGVFTARA